MSNKLPNTVFAENFVAERQQQEVNKYGKRLPIPEMAAHPHVYTKHSIEPAYGQFSEPSSPDLI